MSDTKAQKAVTTPPALRRLRFWTRAALLAEAVPACIGPVVLLLILYAALALLGLLDGLPHWASIALFVGTVIASIALLARGLRRLRLPSPDATDRRLETQSGLSHAPLRTLADAKVIGSSDLWAMHLARAQAEIAKLKLRGPRPIVAAADPRALRALVLLVLAVGLGVAGQDTPNRLARAFWPSLSFSGPTAAPLLQAWIAPPGYTGLPPLVLRPEGGAASVPEGSVFTATFSGDGSETPKLLLGGTLHDFTKLDAAGQQASATLTQSGSVVIHNGPRDLAAWVIAVEPDEPPVVSFPDPPGGVVQGALAETRLPWHVQHRYGVSELHAELVLADRPTVAPLSVPVPLPGTPKDARGAQRTDLSANPWAGLPVNAILAARDVAGRLAHSETRRFVLPERRFRNQMARAVIGVRRQLSLTPKETDRAADALEALGETAEFWDDDPSGYLNLAAIAALLRYGDQPVDEAQSRMWELALHLEEGAPDRTERALEAARRDMRQGLDQKDADAQADQKPDEAANDLPHKAEALAEALRQRLEALSQAARQDPDSNGYNPDAHPKDRRDMQRLSDALKEATKQGKRDIARDLMAELDRKLDALKGQRAERKPGDNAKAEKRRQGKRQLSVVQDMVQREGQLLDRSQFRPYDFQQKPEAAAVAHEADRKTQLALRRALGILMQQYGDLAGSVPPNMGQADLAMRDSVQALDRGHDMEAASAEQRVIEALQQGGRDMRQQMAQQFGQSRDQGDDDQSAQNDEGDEDGDAMAEAEGEGEEGSGGENDPMIAPDGKQGGQNGEKGRQRPGKHAQGRDPLGRPRGDGTGGLDDDGDTAVPEQMEAARTRELQDELRRRSADRTRQIEELQYIERLLKQF